MAVRKSSSRNRPKPNIPTPRWRNETGAVNAHLAKPPFIANPLLRWALIIGSIVSIAWALHTLPFDWARIEQGFSRAAAIFSGSVPPDYTRSALLINGLLESLRIAVLATLLGLVLSVPIAFMAARNVAIKPVYVVGRALVIIARSFHPLIVAIIFVKAVGFVAKMLAERIEGIDPGQVEALRSSGAGYMTVLQYAVLPQIMPRLIGLAMYQTDSNLRASAVVGMVGVGGIGIILQSAINTLHWSTVATVLLAVIAMVIVGEALAVWLRRKII